MTIQAIVFDVYKTLLDLSPPPADAAERWEWLWEDYFADPARLTLEEFDVDCKRVIGRVHASARARGVSFPEVDWTAIAKEVVPELARINASKADEFLFAHAQLQRTVRMSSAAAETLRALQKAGIPLGIASNSQLYTWRELDAALTTHGLDRSIFDKRLCFWSFERGFSKPDSAVFRWLADRLRTLGIQPENALMVGDRQDNDIDPASSVGWQTWKLLPPGTAGTGNAGGWDELWVLLLRSCGLK